MTFPAPDRPYPVTLRQQVAALPAYVLKAWRTRYAATDGLDLQARAMLNQEAAAARAVGVQPDERLVFTIFSSAIAEFERGIIHERTRAGLDAARARGRRGGRPPAQKLRDLKQARALLRDPEITVEAVAGRLKVSPFTL